MKALQNKHTFYIHIHKFLKDLWLKKREGGNMHTVANFLFFYTITR